MEADEEDAISEAESGNSSFVPVPIPQVDGAVAEEKDSDDEDDVLELGNGMIEGE